MLLGLVVILEIGVLHFLPKFASNGVMSIVFCFEIFSCCIIAYSECSNLKFLLSCDFMQDNCRLIVWIKRSTRPIALWSFAGAKISVILFSVQNFSFFFCKTSCLIYSNCSRYSVIIYIFIKKFDYICTGGVIYNFCCWIFWVSVYSCNEILFYTFFITFWSTKIYLYFVIQFDGFW